MVGGDGSTDSVQQRGRAGLSNTCQGGNKS